MKMASITTCMDNEYEWRGLDRREWVLEHYEQRLAYLKGKGAEGTHPEIVRRYERDIWMLRTAHD